MKIELDANNTDFVVEAIKSGKFTVLVGSAAEPFIYTRLIPAICLCAPFESRALINASSFNMYILLVRKEDVSEDIVFNAVEKALGVVRPNLSQSVHKSETSTICTNNEEGLRLTTALSAIMKQQPTSVEIVTAEFKTPARPPTYTQADLN